MVTAALPYQEARRVVDRAVQTLERGAAVAETFLLNPAGSHPKKKAPAAPPGEPYGAARLSSERRAGSLAKAAGFGCVRRGARSGGQTLVYQFDWVACGQYAFDQDRAIDAGVGAVRRGDPA